MPRQSQVAAYRERIADAHLEPLRRLKAPPELTDDQRAEFVRVVDSLPPDWFAQAHLELLVQYCRHVVLGRVLSRQVDEAVSDGVPTKILYELMGRQEANTRMVCKLMTVLRISPQAVEPPRVSQKRIRRPEAETPWSD